jgi:hypothetical protein
MPGKATDPNPLSEGHTSVSSDTAPSPTRFRWRDIQHERERHPA